MRQVQIQESLFVQLFKYHVLNLRGDTIEDEIEKGLTDKMNTISKRLTFTKYKTAKCENEREKAKKEYLDMIGTLKDFRY